MTRSADSSASTTKTIQFTLRLDQYVLWVPRTSRENSVRVITLVENRPNPSDPALVAEWGLSLYIEIGGRRVLVDMGASDAFARNARKLGIDIATIDAAILSHHHYDHGGGLRRFLELNASANVFIGDLPAGQPTARVFGLLKRNIGLDQSLFEQYADRFRFVRERTDVVPGVFVLPNIGGEHPRPSGNATFMSRYNFKDVYASTKNPHRGR